MSETAKQRAARIAAAAGGQSRERSPEGTTSVRAETGKRTAKVRLTVDLDPPLHRRLNNWGSRTAEELEVARVPSAETVRILVEILTNVNRFPKLRPMLEEAVIQEMRDAQ